MSRPVSETFKLALGLSPVEPIELVRIDYAERTGLRRTKQFAIWPVDITFGRDIFRSNPWIVIGEYNIGIEQFPTVDITFLDAERQFRNEFNLVTQQEFYPDLRGAEITIFKVLKDQLTDEADTIKDTFLVSQWSANDEVVVLTCDTFLQSPQRTFPPLTYSRRICQWVFKDAKTCQWVTSQGGNVSFCDKTIAGVNGCLAHQNTRHYGGFPTIADENISPV